MISLVDYIIIFKSPNLLKKKDFLKTWLFPFAALFFLDFLDLSFLNTRLDLKLIPVVHFGAKVSKMTCKKLIFHQN